MNRLLIPVLLLAVLVSSVPALAEIKVGVVNPSRILREMKETKDVESALQAEQQSLQQQLDEKQKKLQDIENQKNQLKPDAPQWAELNRQGVQLRAEAEGWFKNAQQELGRKMRDQSLKLYGKIKDAVAEIAKSEQLDLVLAEASDLPEADLARIPPQQLLGALFANRSVMFRNDSLDITQKVITKLDAGYTPVAK